MMEATKHTPGPWEIVPYGDGSSLVIHSDDDNRVCFMATACADRPSSHATIRANAALIAAAPDLYETERKLCNEVAGIIETWEHALRGVMGNTNFNVLKLRYDEARAALLRASPTEEPALPPQAQAAQETQPQE